MRLLLVRHGQTSWNISGRAQGHTDISLDPSGLEQAAKLGQAMANVQVDRILSSDLARSTETAKQISMATRVPIELRNDLRERGFGEWEGLPFAVVTKQIYDRADQIDVSAQQVRPPGGESFQDVWDRLEAVAALVRESDDTIVVVSHGGALSVLLAKLLKGTLDTFRAFRFSNTGITELERRSDGLYLITRYNDTTHLASERVLSGSLDGVTR